MESYDPMKYAVGALSKDPCAPRFKEQPRSYYPLDTPRFLYENYPGLVVYDKGTSKVGSNQTNGMDMLAKVLIDLGYRFHEDTFYYFNGMIYESTPEKVLQREMTHATQQGPSPPGLPIGFKKDVLSHLKDLPEGALPDGSRLIALDPRYDGWLIPFENGIYNVERDELLPFSPFLGFTFQIHADYRPIENHPVEEIYRKIISHENGAMLDAFLTAVGYTLYAEKMDPPAMFFLLGPGGTGKSTMLDVMRTLIGDDLTSSADIEQISGQFGASALRGKRANLCDELPYVYETKGKARTKGYKLKAMSAGKPVQVEAKYEQASSIAMNTKLWFASNGIPDLGDSSDGMRRRIYPFPFDTDLKGDNFTDEEYESLFSYEGLAWLAFRSLKAYISFLISKEKTLPMTEEMRFLRDKMFIQDPLILYFMNYAGGTSIPTIQDYFEGKTLKSAYEEYVDFTHNEGYLETITKPSFEQILIVNYGMEVKRKSFRTGSKVTSHIVLIRRK